MTSDQVWKQTTRAGFSTVELGGEMANFKGMTTEEMFEVLELEETFLLSDIAAMAIRQNDSLVQVHEAMDQ